MVKHDPGSGSSEFCASRLAALSRWRLWEAQTQAKRGCGVGATLAASKNLSEYENRHDDENDNRRQRHARSVSAF